MLGGYRIIRAIGSGGMGTVYEVEHSITRRTEAMKVLPLGVGVAPEAVEQFEQEIQAQARLLHPQIAALYTAVREPGAIGLVMEYVPGEPLARVLEARRPSVQQAAAWTRQILDALAHAHRNGVVHCDVSPANIIVTPSGDVKLTDFGLARAANDLAGSSDGIPAGSPWNMSPEQVRGVTAVDQRADVYGAGAVLYEMLAGRKLFDADGSFEILRAHLEVVPRPPSAHNRAVPPSLDRVVLKALAKEPSARFADAAAFRAAMDAALSDSGRIAPWIWGAAASFVIVCAGFAGFARIDSAAALPPPPLPTAPELIVPPEATITPTLPPVVVEQKPPRRAERARTRERFEAPPPAPAVRSAAVELLPVPAPDPPKPDAGDLPLPAVAEPVAPDAPISEAKPQKTGNRFVRALGKLNPFRKSEKSDKDQ